MVLYSRGDLQINSFFSAKEALLLPILPVGSYVQPYLIHMRVLWFPCSSILFFCSHISPSHVISLTFACEWSYLLLYLLSIMCLMSETMHYSHMYGMIYALTDIISFYIENINIILYLDIVCVVYYVSSSFGQAENLVECPVKYTKCWYSPWHYKCIVKYNLTKCKKLWFLYFHDSARVQFCYSGVIPITHFHAILIFPGCSFLQK